MVTRKISMLISYEVEKSDKSGKKLIGFTYHIDSKNAIQSCIAFKMKLPGFEMTELYSELLLHDEMLMEHKRTRSENDDGNKDAELTERLLAIMEKYGLAGKKPAYDGRKDERMKHRFLEDPKLEKLWKTVKKNGKFTEEELQTLENEFQHHRRKLYELESLKSEISDIDALHDNSVEKQLIQDTRSEKKQKVAELYGDIAEGYERLSLKAKQGALSADSVPFTEPRVAQLWEEAKNAGFSDEELESIKEELNHFQIKVQKHLFFKDQLKNSVEKIDNYGGHDKAPKPQADTHSHLQKKVKELASKVKKLHHRISQKLSSGSQDRGEL